MKKAILCLVLMLTAAVFLSGCATPFPLGQIYTGISSPVAAGNGDLAYTKVGTAVSTSILGLVATGDASIKTAAANGGITKVKYVDYRAKNILGIFGKYTTTVYGD